jgi:hypothetical protein
MLLALLCILLLVVAGTVQVAHMHSDGAANHADCSLCVAAHLSVHVAEMPSATPVAVVFAAVESVAPVDLPSALSTFALFTRPPPASVFPA